ncbi:MULTISPECIES: hypothetical protein [unclassified Carboxylicivirga]|uniref:hypothetical protein n=1 Tax=Carboxylicivirga TaxID=1628153 RepID=UPI003D35288C
MKKIVYSLLLCASILMVGCNDYDVQQAAPESTFLEGINIGYYNPDVSNTTHGKVSIASEMAEYDYLDPNMIIDSVFIKSEVAQQANFSLSDAWVTLSVGSGSVRPEQDSPELGSPADFSEPVFYTVKSVYGEERLYKIVFKIR